MTRPVAAGALWSDASAAADPRGRHLVVLLHGAGGVPGDLAPVLDALPAGVVGVSLAGRLVLRDRWAWADVARSDAPGFEESAAAVAGWLAGQGGWPSVGLVGFSQGGAVAVQMLRADPGRFRYAVTLSAFLARVRDRRDAAVAAVRPPVLVCHGDRDDVVPEPWAARLAAWAARNAAATTRWYEGLAHTMDDREVADVVAFVGEHAGNA
ncbi:alpha/beta hydrolase [Cellulomonas pakistanensis]|uniref:Esterase n=1 Tax=Cellulomonas pakistanensis TaxID=992287 RepID=A0A919P656_9CELL|nr:dienelactone hydrolase family protein [Cellulomonas pakistanensis]GIG34965.1 esterase [Cellulomonas pakistanensis]